MTADASVRRVLITGPTRGIGRAAALAFGRRGLHPVLFGRDDQALERVADEVSTTGATAAVAACDLADRAAIGPACRTVLERYGPPDVLVHNAGMIDRGPTVEQTDPASWDRVVDVNLGAPFRITRELLPAMRARGTGRILFVSSISATIGCAGAASYAASKWGLVGLMKSLAEELRGSGLVTAAVLPGSVDTDMLVGSGFAPAMTADDVASVLVYLALDAPPSIHASAVEQFG